MALNFTHTILGEDQATVREINQAHFHVTSGPLHLMLLQPRTLCLQIAYSCLPHFVKSLSQGDLLRALCKTA